jgi:hypothetical protein
MKERLIDLVEEFGSAGNGKSKLEKSKLLHGLTHELVATFGVSTSINTAAVDRFADVVCIVISSGQELGPTHVSLRAVAAIMITSLDSPWKGEQDAQSISRCFTAHHRDFRAVLRANRTSQLRVIPSLSPHLAQTNWQAARHGSEDPRLVRSTQPGVLP